MKTMRAFVVVLFAALVVIISASCSHNGNGGGTGPSPVVNISPIDFTINAGETRMLTVTASDGTQPRCSAEGQNLPMSGSSLPFSRSSDAESGNVPIICTSGGANNSATAHVTGSVTLEYESSMPSYTSAPTTGLPSVFIGILSGGGNFSSTNSCQNPSWVPSGNHWKCTFLGVDPSVNLVRVADAKRANAEGNLQGGWYCASVRYHGAEAVPFGSDSIGCRAKFR